MKYTLVLFFISTVVFSQVHTVAFYNLENLFDVYDDPAKNDEDFTPEGSYGWTEDQYLEKLRNLAQVIYELGDVNGPEILGASEVENRQVLEDLIIRTQLADRGYGIVHFESPDRRGIDVALLYKTRLFTPLATSQVVVRDPDNPNFRTRNQLVVTGTFEKDTITFIVNHWPSRYGGGMELRALAAEAVSEAVDSLQQAHQNAKIIIMGDFNDDPNNKSIRKILNARGKRSKLKPEQLYNPLDNLFRDNQGTLAYRGRWNLFDQLILSQSLLGVPEGSYGYVDYSARIFIKDYMVEQEGNYAGYPRRAFVGGKWNNGYSDHFPVFLYLSKTKVTVPPY